MNLQRIADSLDYEKGRCEHCQGQRYIFRTAAEAGEGRKGLSLCTPCNQTGYLWYPKLEDPAIHHRLPGAGINSEELIRRWQQRRTRQQL